MQTACSTRRSQRRSCSTAASRRAAPSCPSKPTDSAPHATATASAPPRATTMAWTGSPLHSCSPGHLDLRGSSSPPDWPFSARSPNFSIDALAVGEEEGSGQGAGPRYHQLTNATSQEALVGPSGSASSRPGPSPYSRRSRRPDSQVLVSGSSGDLSPGEPSSPSVVLDKKTKKRFLDLGVTLRRSYIRVRKDKTNRLSVGSREASQSPCRSFVSFSWLTDGRAALSSSSPPSPSSSPASPRPPSLRPPRRSHSQESALSEEFSPPPTSSCTSPPGDSASSSAHPYHTLSQSSDEASEQPPSPLWSWSSQQVCDWLQGLHMDQYVPQFRAQEVDGQQLLHLDGAKLKGLGVLRSSDRSALKRRIKEVQSAAEKERKALDKKEKQRQRKN
ncbi:sterile alpha motif domain-containing protein 14 isoform X2 [Nelusetta ayraudi]|uniref:sterile alpha motif domain-containing protein 14 isoform X2 n=1 Tax=Nelusetta ayraudi TaxID=303726 RepID=UPI003F6E9586